jgi:pSer/pThr/pTyr-binding forkhead associated (FHA) protein
MGQDAINHVSGEQYGLKFVFESGEFKVFDSLPISLGRAEQNDIVLSDDSISAMHAKVYYDQQIKDICIVDLDSLNGLYVDGQPTRKNILYDGVQIGLGKVVFTFRDTGYIHPS